jgi:hypothetical protein
MIETNACNNFEAKRAHEPGDEHQSTGAEQHQQKWLRAEHDKQEWLRTQQETPAQ